MKHFSSVSELNLDDFFSRLQDEAYCIVKMSEEFPRYFSGSDIDLFCCDAQRMAAKILEVGNQYLEYGFEMEVTNRERASHIYVDFYREGELEFRFDIYQKLPQYKRVHIRPGLFPSIIEHRVAMSRESDGETYNIYVPSEIDDFLLRYIEYTEWYKTRPNKIKHLDYILSKASGIQGSISFLDKLHYYTALPEDRHSETGLCDSRLRYYRELITFLFKRARSKRASELPGALYAFLKRRATR